MKISQLKADPSLSTNGVDIPFGEEVDGKQATLKIAYNGNSNFRNKLAQLTRRAASQLTGREMPPETAIKLNREAIAGTVLVGWSNLDNDDGSPIEYSEKEARDLLEIPLVWDFVQFESQRLENFQRQKEAASDAEIKSGADMGTETRQGPATPARSGGSRISDSRVIGEAAA